MYPASKVLIGSVMKLQARQPLPISNASSAGTLAETSINEIYFDYFLFLRATSAAAYSF